MKYAAVLGRNPGLSIAELTALGLDPQALNDQAARINGQSDRLGGTLKIIELQGSATSPEQAVADLAGTVTTTGKVTFGLSIYGHGSPKLAIAAKKHLKSRGLSARFVPSKGPLNLAQVKHNGLLKEGFEWCLFQTKKGWEYGRTIWIPDFEGFARRDYEKPVSDSKRGMLPPQLARTMVNLATTGKDVTVYDPFCGVGGLLMEAAATGHRAIGTDLEQAAVDGARQNLEWLSAGDWDVSVHNATQPLPVKNAVIATEGYLGVPIRESTTEADIEKQRHHVSVLLMEFFKQAQAALPSGGRLVITFPVWKVGAQKIHLEIIDEILALGYTKFRDSIEVGRPKQRVLHELTIFEKI